MKDEWEEYRMISIFRLMPDLIRGTYKAFQS